MLKLGKHGTSWSDLLEKIKKRESEISVSGIPYAMQPEVYCGVDVEDIQRQIARGLSTDSTPHSLLKELLGLPFDAIITTNYTYEIEMILSGGKWTKTDRKNSFFAMDGNSRVNHNTFVCNVVREVSGRIVPVFHIHGEIARKHSIILSYYSYAKSVFKLLEYNKNWEIHTLNISKNVYRFSVVVGSTILFWEMYGLLALA